MLKFTLKYFENQNFKITIALVTSEPISLCDSKEIKPLAMLAISDEIVSDHTTACIVFFT